MRFIPHNWSLAALAALVAGLGWPAVSGAQTVSGRAQAVEVRTFSLFGSSTTVLADTGALSHDNDAREASEPTGGVPSVVAGSTLHASTIGWSDQASSEASMADLAISVAGVAVGADFVMSRVTAQGAGSVGAVAIDGLSINGIAIDVTGEPNQTIAIPGGRIVINEQRRSASQTVVNALHIMVAGLADVVIASSTAGAQ